MSAKVAFTVVALGFWWCGCGCDFVCVSVAFHFFALLAQQAGLCSIVLVASLLEEFRQHHSKLSKTVYIDLLQMSQDSMTKWLR